MQQHKSLITNRCFAKLYFYSSHNLFFRRLRLAWSDGFPSVFCSCANIIEIGTILTISTVLLYYVACLIAIKSAAFIFLATDLETTVRAAPRI